MACGCAAISGRSVGMKSKMLFRLGLVGVLGACVSCQGPLQTRDGASGGGRVARAEDGLQLSELAAIDSWQSREVSVDVASVGSPVKLVYQMLGESDSTVMFLYPTAVNSTMVLALKHVAKAPLQVYHLWRNGSVPTPNAVYRKEIDPAPTINASCNWNPALGNLKPGNTVVAVWPNASGSVSFDPISTNFRARLVLVLPAKP